MRTDLRPRPNKIEYYCNIALEVARRGTCQRRNYGAIIVSVDQIIATGYSGAPRGKGNCTDPGRRCVRDELAIPQGERYELCRSVHAEQNAIISASRLSMVGASMFVLGIDNKTGEILHVEPCLICRKMIVNAGIYVTYISKEICFHSDLWEI